MITAYVEISGEARALAEWEAISAAEALGGSAGHEGPRFRGLVAVVLPSESAVAELAARLSLAYRCLRPLVGPTSLAARLEAEGRRGGSAMVRRVGSPSGRADPAVLRAGASFVRRGGRIDLERPDRRFWLATDEADQDWLLEEAGDVDRARIARRRMPRLPFQRPVSLPPHLGRAAANLARVRPGDRVLDPFLGTGALLAEAGLLGASVSGIDRSAAMVRGALRNLEFLGVDAVEVLEGDAGTVEFSDPERPFDALLTDPPYGRSSPTGGEAADRLVARVLPRWARRLAPGARVVVVVPAGSPEVENIGDRRGSVAVRVHRSLTREFRVYEVPTRTPR
jgi:tRNA (guanine10-N2)-dimethyltransferase